MRNFDNSFPLDCICGDWIELTDSISFWEKKATIEKKELKCFAIAHNANIRWR